MWLDEDRLLLSHIEEEPQTLSRQGKSGGELGPKLAKCHEDIEPLD